jgi:hypothetical protein
MRDGYSSLPAPAFSSLFILQSFTKRTLNLIQMGQVPFKEAWSTFPKEGGADLGRKGWSRQAFTEKGLEQAGSGDKVWG